MLRRRTPISTAARTAVRNHLHQLVVYSSALVLLAAAQSGCEPKKPKASKVELQGRYTTLPLKKVPPFLKDTILEKCDLMNTEPFLVTSYGFVVNLDGTGGTEAPNAVREYIVKDMIKHKWGSSLSGIKMPPPDVALQDPRNAIVQVDGYLPPGVRKGQRFDVQVTALPESSTTSLAQGDLLQAELRIFGANPADPGGAVNVFGRAEGPIFVNPAYALKGKESAANDAAAKRSLRMGIVMSGASSLIDRPMGLRLRNPSLRMSKYIEERIDRRLQEVKPDIIADAQDEGIVHLYVPVGLNGDWEHFAGLVLHLYLDNTPEFTAAKAQQLADEAVKPDAPLMDISYCWEALGKVSLPVIRDRGLMSNPNQDIAYAAARAAAFLGDSTAPMALVRMATTNGNKFQVNAVQVLGSLPSSPAINELIRPLLNSDQTLVRLEAYRMLSHNGDNSVFTTQVPTGFALDVVKSDGPPLIFATRRGEARLAIIGNRTSVKMPITYSTMDGRLTISSDPGGKSVTIYYRPPMPAGGPRTREQADRLKPIQVVSHPDIAEIVARLSGEGFDDAPNGQRLDFNYGEIISILNSMAENQQLTAVANGNKTPASFILQELSPMEDTIYSAPVIPEQSRPQSEPAAPSTKSPNANDVGESRVGMAK